MTSGYTFEGYTITKYIDVIGSEAAIGSGFLAELEGSLSDVVGAESTAFSNKIQTARKTAKSMLLQEAFEIGANAVIGLDYQYFALRSNMICVCAKGTAIYVEKS